MRHGGDLMGYRCGTEDSCRDQAESLLESRSADPVLREACASPSPVSKTHNSTTEVSALSRATHARNVLKFSSSQLVLQRTLDFRQARNQAHLDSHQVFIDLFAGAGLIASKWRSNGYAALAIDRNRRTHWDSDSIGPWNQLISWLKAGIISGVCIAIPCTTFSIARHPALRSKKHNHGITRC